MHPSSDYRKASLALILGSLGGVLTMAIHPTMLTPNFALLSPLAHTLGIVSVLLLFLGSFALARALAAQDRLAFTALVTFGLASVAILTAAAVSGFVAPRIVRMQAHDIPEAAAMWRIAAASLFQLNQAFSLIYSVATAAAITLWSIASLRLGRLSRSFAIYGCITSPIVALLLFTGHLRLDVHGMTAVMLSEVVWFVGMALALHREPAN